MTSSFFQSRSRNKPLVVDFVKLVPAIFYEIRRLALAELGLQKMGLLAYSSLYGILQRCLAQVHYILA